MLLIGAHMSVAGGPERAFARGEALGCTAMQIFTKNANQWRGRPIVAGEAAAFKAAHLKSPIGPVVAHVSYLINLAAPEADKWERSRAGFLDELQRCAALGIEGLVMHPGAHIGTGIEAGLARIAEALRLVFAEAPPQVTILLENTAGQGSYLGDRFEHLAEIMEQVPGGRFGVCLDTCHAFAAGYDLSTAEGYAAVIAEFDRRVGIEHLRVFHLNDSQKGCGSHVDRHVHIGKGTIGEEGFRALLTDPRFAAVPKILETPKGDDDSLDLMNLAKLRELAGEA